MMKYRSFEDNNLKTVSDALHIAEERTGDFYKFSFNQWKRHHYDVKTQSFLAEDEITPDGFALLNKCSSDLESFDGTRTRKDFYMICLQDHQILKALRRDNYLQLLPLLIYIFTHELIHIVRFCNFSQRYELSMNGKENEERVVHAMTHKILKDLSMPKLDYILKSYRDHRICDLGIA